MLNMHVLDIQQNALIINGKQFPLSFSVDNFIAAFGDQYQLEKPSSCSYVDSYRWHDPSIFFNKDSDSILMTSKDISIVYQGQALPEYYAEHDQARVFLSKSATTLDYLQVADHSYVHLIYNADSVAYYFSLGQQATYPKYENLNELSLKKQPEYIQLWQEWIAAVSKNTDISIVNNILQSGITQRELDTAAHLHLPEALVALYAVYDVDQSSEEWIFTLDEGDCFELLSFDAIAEEWEQIQDLISDTEDMMDGEYFGDYDQEIDVSHYAKPEWIPIATDKQGDYLLIDLAPSQYGKKGQIIVLNNESWDRYVVAPSLDALIHQKIRQLNTNI